MYEIYIYKYIYIYLLNKSISLNIVTMVTLDELEILKINLIKIDILIK